MFDPIATAGGLATTADDANAALSAVGNKVTDAVDNTLYVIFDKPIEGDYLITVDVDDKSYGIVSTAKDRVKVPGCIKLYFQLTDGKQTDFVDGEVATPETGAFDLSSYEGDLLLSVYRTNEQSPGVYPTGRVLVKRKTIHIGGSD